MPTAGYETDWPASARLDSAIERVVREAIQSGLPLQEALAKVEELTRAEQSPLSENALNRRLRAQLIADS